MSNMIKGETVEVVCDYSLFGTNIKGFTGFYIEESTTGTKHLIHIPDLSEWCELKPDQFERSNPESVSPEAAAFVSKLRKLGD